MTDEQYAAILELPLTREECLKVVREIRQAARATPADHSVPVAITKGERDGNWQDFGVNGHGGFIRIVARMEDDDEDLPLSKVVEEFLLAAPQPTQPEAQSVPRADCGETLPGEFYNAEDLIKAMGAWPTLPNDDHIEAQSVRDAVIEAALSDWSIKHNLFFPSDVWEDLRKNLKE